MFMLAFYVFADLSDVNRFSAFGFYNCMLQLLSLALKPADLSKVLGNVFEQAQQLKKATKSSCASIYQAPNVTVSYMNACGVYCQ